MTDMDFILFAYILFLHWQHANLKDELRTQTKRIDGLLDMIDEMDRGDRWHPPYS